MAITVEIQEYQMGSLFLDETTWDICADAQRNLAITQGPKALIQRVACEIKHLKGEGWYDETQGVPHFVRVLGVETTIPLIIGLIENHVAQINSVASVIPLLQITKDRQLIGDVRVTTEDGENLNVSI